MSKDPAFLFYSKDYYEGTRMMLPEERACYIDLMIYQHQNGGIIPNDIRRLMMYCSGVSEATLKATLVAKFKLCDKGWYNDKLKKVVEERENFSKKQSINGVVGQFWKRANKVLSKKELAQLKKTVAEICNNNKTFNDNWLSKIKDPKAMLEAMLKHLEDVNVIEDVNKEENKNGKEVIGEKPKIIFPFDTENFKTQWQLWKTFKQKEFKFKYKSEISEQAALKKLSELSKLDEKTAIAIIHQSIENSWKGLFELKQSSNGKQIGKKTVQYSDDFKRGLFEKLQPK